MMAHGLLGPNIRVYRVPEGTKWLVMEDERDENNSADLLQLLKGEALQIVVGEYTEAVYIWPEKRIKE